MGLKPRSRSSDAAETKTQAKRAAEILAERLKVAFGPSAEVLEKKMFGGTAFMVRGHMSVGTLGADLMVRVGPDR